ncbi:MAG: putative rane protein [Rhizobacter sp.]|nr:putative rane protein [Rhizobacter sp.]
MLTTLLAFLATLAVLIVVHEYGHYRVAVACGVKVLRFSVGFGRVVLRRQPTPGGTEFVVSALPLGGYVRMLDEREGPVPADQLHLAFNRKSLWKRSAIVAAGPAANLILAVLLYSAANWIGVDEPKALLGAPAPASLADQAGLRAGDWVRSYSQDGVEWEDVRSMTDLRWEVTQSLLRKEPLQLEVSDRFGHGQRQVQLALDTLGGDELDAETMRRIGLGAPFSEAVLGEVRVGGPAAKAGLHPGDRVRSVDGVRIDDAMQLRELIRSHTPSGDGTAMQWEVERSGQLLHLDVTPASAEDGGKLIGRVEAYIGLPPEMVTVGYGPFEGVSQAISRTWEVSTLSLKMLGRMVIGQASLKNLSGPLTIADYAGQSVRMGPAYYLGFLALVSVSLGILNLLPLPMLDGGHLMYYLFEGVTGRPVSELWLDRLQRGGVAIMFMMMSLALYNDIARLLGFQ